MDQKTAQVRAFEIERKFLIRYPDLKYLNGLDNCSKSGIIQTYLPDTDEETSIRIRKRGIDGIYTYTYTKKRRISDTVRDEQEYVITEGEYLELLKKADPALKTIIKDRYCISYLNQMFEIDIFPFWNDRAFMEIELVSEDQVIEFPGYIRIIKEVTYDKRYTNRALAKEIPMEKI